MNVDSHFSLLLFKLYANSGKRRFVFSHIFLAFDKRDILISFINVTFLCLMYGNVFKVFKCDILHPFDGSSVDPVSVPICWGTNPRPNFRNTWYHEIMFQSNDSFILEIYSIGISLDNSSVVVLN